ncbi:MAG: glycine cleavage system aminomethyltransferase GcvT [Endomicrobium sp.]|jgi:aminomethyltransferase|nr:glycine cleavage system aminomethyltransferase GcvT [Endomicrobium sp.]
MKKTCLYNEHEKLGAKFINFHEWLMPIQYTSIINEHNSVRENVGMFDISHMGTFIISGKDAEHFINYVTLGNIINLPIGKAKYSMILNMHGGIKDDIIVYKYKTQEYMVVVNSGNISKVFTWLHEQYNYNKHIYTDVRIYNISNMICLISIQGPLCIDKLQFLTKTNIKKIKYFSIVDIQLNNLNSTFCKIARTGYTGEDGFEIFISNKNAIQLWRKLLKLSIPPCGLGSRNTLRLESCMPLYGNELHENIDPISLGFNSIINWDATFVGKDTLLNIKNNCSRKLIKFECVLGIAREMDKVCIQDTIVGYVTSGAFSPTLKKAIGLALINVDVISNNLTIKIHGRNRPIKVIDNKFYIKCTK